MSKAAADLLERDRGEVIAACEQRLFGTANPALIDETGREFARAFIDAGFDGLLAMLRGDDPAGQRSADTVSGVADHHVHPDESFRISIELFDVISAFLLAALTSCNVPSARIATIFSDLHNDLAGKAFTAAQSYIEYLLERVQTANADERHRISRELDERVTPGVQSASDEFELYDRYRGTDQAAADQAIQTATAGLADTLDTIREVNSELRIRLPQKSLELGLRAYVSSLDQQLPDTWISVAGDESWIGLEVRDVLYTIFCEAIRTVLRHAEVMTVEIQVHIAPHEVRCFIVNDGAQIADELSLTSLRGRLELLRGSVCSWSLPGGGGRLRLIVPLAGGVRPVSL